MGYDTARSTDRLGDALDGDAREQHYADDEARDLRFQAFMDFARVAHVDIMLEHVAMMLRGQTDPYYTTVHQPLWDVAESDGWSTVISLIAHVQKEKEAAF